MENAAILETWEQVLTQNGEAWLAPHGVSMGRRYAGAEALLVRRATRAAPRWGSFVVVRAGTSRWVAHRVIAVWRGDGACRFLTKGDGRVEVDWPPRKSEDWVGEIVAFRRAGREWRLDGWRGAFAQRLHAAVGLIHAVAWEAVRFVTGRQRI